MKELGFIGLMKFHRFEIGAMIFISGGFTVTELALFDALLDIGIKIVTYLTSIILLLIAYQKHRRYTMENEKMSYELRLQRPDGGGDGEDGSSGTKPGEGGDGE